MFAAATTTVEIDSELLSELRERDPGKGDRGLLEELAAIVLGFGTIERVQERNAGVDDDEVMAGADDAVREVRREMAAERRAGG